MAIFIVVLFSDVIIFNSGAWDFFGMQNQPKKYGNVQKGFLNRNLKNKQFFLKL